MKLRIVFTLLAAALLLLTGCGEQTVEDRELTVTIGAGEYTGLYSGPLSGKQAQGLGSIQVESRGGTWRYEGWFERSAAAGDGTFTKLPLSVSFQGKSYDGLYTGEAVSGVVEGQGRFLYEERSQWLEYEGGFSQGEFAGAGQMDTSLLKVEYIDVVRTGRYRGESLDGAPHGTGSFHTVNEDVTYTHEGEWREGLPHGQGVRTFEDGRVFLGNFTLGDFDPALDEAYRSLGSTENARFDLGELAAEFLREHPELFPAAGTAALAPYTAKGIRLEQLYENPEAYGDRLLVLEEFLTTEGGELILFDWTFTMFGLVDPENTVGAYLIFYPGSVDVPMGETATVYALPLGRLDSELVGDLPTYVFVASHVELLPEEEEEEEPPEEEAQDQADPPATPSTQDPAPAAPTAPAVPATPSFTGTIGRAADYNASTGQFSSTTTQFAYGDTIKWCGTFSGLSGQSIVIDWVMDNSKHIKETAHNITNGFHADYGYMARYLGSGAGTMTLSLEDTGAVLATFSFTID